MTYWQTIDYACETSTWFSGSFRPGDGSDIRETVVHGTEDFPEGLPGKTTMDVSVSDRLGRSIASETHVRTEEGYERISWTEYEYDQRGNQIGTRSSDGSRTESAWGCCGKESDRDASGILTTYEYDDLRRLVSSSRESLDGDVVTTYEYDATGRRLSQTVSAGGISLTTGNDYDDAGRLVRTIDAAGLATTYEYSDDGLTTTVTRPGGATEITERHLDGQIKSVTGTAVVDRYYFYGVDPDGTRWTETRVGRPDSPMFERTRTDCLGRTVKTETAAFEGASKTTEYEYDQKGRLIRTSTAGRADTLYAYDELGNQYRSGLDVDGNSQLIPASDDRITESETAFSFVDDTWWQQTVQTVYPESDSEDSVEVSQSLSRLTDLGTDNLVSESVQIDIHGKRTVSRSRLDRETRTRTNTTDHPDSDTDSETVGRYGLTVSSTTKTGLTTIFGYDGLGRRTETTDPRTGTSLAHYDASGRPDWTEDAAGNRTSYSYDPSTGLEIAEYNPEGKATRHIYNARGQITHTWGDVPYPVRYVYDEYGRMIQMHTFRTGENWSFAMWPTGLEGEADVTTWHYDEASGLLAAKEYADGARTTYTYNPSGNLETRTWARLVDGNPLVTTYSYDPETAELTAIDYSDSTPDITFAYDRLGRRKTITDAAGTRTFAYNEYLRLKAETVTGPINHTIIRTYDSAEVPGRSTGFALSTDDSTPDSPEYAVSYGYDESGRFETLSWNVDADPATDTDTPSTGTTAYSYLPDSDLLQGYATSSGGPAGQQTTYAYEPHRNLKTLVENAFGAKTISRYEYQYDTLGRRTTVLNTGSAFDQPAFEKYQYDDRSQLVSAARYLGSDISNTDTPADDRYRDYAYDPIGNRVNATEGAENPDAPDASKTLTYTSNQLNQYDLITETNGTATSRNLTYDPDGNLVSGLDDWIFSYNAENRLVSAEPQNPAEGDKRLEFAYDYMGRRIRKIVQVRTSASWVLEKQILFAYDGWNMIQEKISESGAFTAKSYIWALDFSQSLTGVGGIGGLITMIDDSLTFFFSYDGNGNVGQMVKAVDGVIAAAYGYDPYGNVNRSHGDLDNDNKFRFSTKYHDDEIELVYYGYRYYALYLGRWINRDPFYENGGINLYVFITNSPVIHIDLLGLHAEIFEPFPYTSDNGIRAHNTIFQWIRDQEYPEIRDLKFDRAFQWMGLGLSLKRPDIIDTHQKEIWEIKPVTHRHEKYRKSDFNQLFGYIEELEKSGNYCYEFGDAFSLVPYSYGGVFAGTFSGSWHDKWEVRIWPSKSKKGFILYSLKYKGNDLKESIEDMDPATVTLMIILGIITVPILAL